jgi:hypothetical protein
LKEITSPYLCPRQPTSRLDHQKDNVACGFETKPG